MRSIITVGLLSSAAVAEVPHNALSFEYRPADQRGTYVIDGTLDTTDPARTVFRGTVTALVEDGVAKPGGGEFRVSVLNDRAQPRVVTMPGGVFVLGGSPDESTVMLRTGADRDRVSFALTELGGKTSLGTIVTDNTFGFDEREVEAVVALLDPQTMNQVGCDPTFSGYLRAAELACADGGLNSLYYECDPLTGSVQCKFTCTRAAGGGPF